MWKRLKSFWNTNQMIDTLLSLAGFRPGPKQMARERHIIIEDIKRQTDELNTLNLDLIRDTGTQYVLNSFQSHLKKTDR